MPIFILLGWLVGLILGSVLGVAAIAGLSLVFPPFLAPLLAGLTGILTIIPPLLLLIASLSLLILAYGLAYFIATVSIVPLVPPFTGFVVPTPGGVPVIVPATSGEFFGRGMCIGLTAATNFLALSVFPVAGPFLAPWAFTIISLAAIIFVARNPFYQGFLGWAAWLFPLSYVATAVGLLLFLVNLPFAFTMLGMAAFRIDFTTGVIETAGGLPALPIFTGFSGFSLGNFTFVVAPPPAGAFGTPSTSSHEIGHSLNTAAFGGIVLWINAIDENILPARVNLAYGELAAEGHASLMATAIVPARPRFSIRIWF